MKKNNSFIPVFISISGVSRFIKIWGLILLLSNIIFLSFVIAQENRITTFFPTYSKEEDIPSKLETQKNGLQLYFNLDSFPKSGKITNAFLKLTKNNTYYAAKETIMLYSDSTYIGGESLTSFEAQNENTIVSIQINPSFIKPPYGLISVTLKSTGEKNLRTWYSNKATSSNYRPRLVIEYTVPGEPVTQSDGLPDVRSTKAFVPTVKPDTKATFSYKCREFPKAYSYTPAFYNGRVYFITDDEGKDSLKVFDAVGNRLDAIDLTSKLKEKNLSLKIGQHLLISTDGRMYIVGENRILCFKVDEQDGHTGLEFVKDYPKKDEKVFLNPSVPPSLGPDGSLFFVNGLEVYGFNPDLQELWKVTIKDMTTSPLTIGPSGKYVYLVTKGEGLVAINAQTGQSVESSLSNQETLPSSKDNTALFVPIVIRKPDGTEKIYIAANSTNDGRLDCYDNPNTENNVNIDSTLQPLVDNRWNLKGFWTQPIAYQFPPDSTIASKEMAKKEIYAVRFIEGKASLVAADWLSGSITTLGSLDVSKESLNGCNLVMEHNGNCIFRIGDGEKSGLYVYEQNNNGNQGVLKNINNVGSVSLPPTSRLYLDMYNILYAMDVKDRVFMLIKRYNSNNIAAYNIQASEILGYTKVLISRSDIIGRSKLTGKALYKQIMEDCEKFAYVNKNGSESREILLRFDIGQISLWEDIISARLKFKGPSHNLVE